MSCTSASQPDQSSKSGIIQRIIHFNSGNVSGMGFFSDTMMLWYKDSTIIEQVNRVDMHTDYNNVRTVRNIPILFRYIDLQKNILYDYRNFSDTARVINKDVLPDSMMNDYGWSFYSEKLNQIKGEPEPMNDTLIGLIVYKRVKFNFLYDNPEDRFLIGYFRCDNKGLMFSLEKKYSRKINCTMVKFIDYRYRDGEFMPYASVEIHFLSDTISENQLAIFNAWEKKAKANPIRN